MGLFSGFKKVGGKIVDVRVDKWMSANTIKDSFEKTTSLISDMVIPAKPQRKETFREALARLNITEADLEQRKKEFFRLVVIYTLIGLSIVIYGIYMAVNQHFAAGLISICLSLFSFGQAFRFHFWLFQVQHRKLGCSVNEWLNSKVSGEEIKEPVPPAPRHAPKAIHHEKIQIEQKK
jgi:intracellular multiplication protein IcmV